MKEYTQKELRDALIKIGLKEGDVVLASTQLFHLGRLAGVKNREDYARSILDAIFRAIGETGTLVVNTYTTQVGRHGVVFEYEKTRCTTGYFSEYVLFHPDSIRSPHPINSVAALGKRKEEICLDVSCSNYGLDSPFDRMLKMDAQVLRLGIDYSHNVYMHYVETLYGVPYFYNKLLDVTVLVNGKKMTKEFFATVRYLEYPLDYDFERMKNALDEAKCVSSEAVGSGCIHRVSARDYCNIALKLLKKDPYAFLSTPPKFEKGKIPFDGITVGRDGVTGEANYKF